MLALKKKREAEAKAKAEAAEQQQIQTAGDSEETTPQQTTSTAKVSLLGIGGKKNDRSNEKSVGKKRTPGEIRIQKDIEELDGGKVATVEFPNPNDLTIFHVYVTPDSGFWKGATYLFHFAIPDHYVSNIWIHSFTCLKKMNYEYCYYQKTLTHPLCCFFSCGCVLTCVSFSLWVIMICFKYQPHLPPKVTCQTKIYHPNINLEGNVCLNILREDWKPVLDINAVIYGLIYLFYEPNPDDPLNHEAAELFRTDVLRFESIVKRTLRGAYVGSEYFERLI